MSGLLDAQVRPNTLKVNRRRRQGVIGTELIRPIPVQLDEGKGVFGEYSFPNPCSFRVH